MSLATITQRPLPTRLRTHPCGTRRARCPTARSFTQHAEPAVVQFKKDDQHFVTKGLQTIGTAFVSDAVTKYLAPGAEADSCIQKVRSYGEYQLAESSSADLLFQAEDCAAAAFCYRIPEQLALAAPEEQPQQLPAKSNPAELLDLCFAKGRQDFLQEHGPFILVSLIGVHPDKQRRGLGGRLLTMIGTIADREQKWCYLEASSDANAAMYMKHGFVPLSTTRPEPEGPLIKLMGRPPQ